MSKYFHLLISYFFFTGLLIAQEIGDTNLLSANRTDSAFLSFLEFRDLLNKSETEFDTTSSLAIKEKACNQLSIIAAQWATRWEAHYYVCKAQTILSVLKEGSKVKDSLLNEADKHIDIAKELYAGENDEIYVLASLKANARLAIDPMTRWKEYSAIFISNIEKAKMLQPNNPRIYYIMGNFYLRTPTFLGGGIHVALPNFEKADSLFRIEIQDDILCPAWGRKQNEEMLNACREKLK